MVNRNDPQKPEDESRERDRIVELEAEIAALATQNDELTREAADLRRQVERAERLRRDTVTAIDSYLARFKAELRIFRKQRAWMVMLYIRKAYTVLFRRRSIGGIAGLIFRPSKKLDVHDLRLPDLKHTLPRGLRYPFAIDLPQDVTHVDGRSGSFSGVVPQQRKYDLVILPPFDFDFRCQRPQHMAMQFAAAGHRVFWVSPSRNCAQGRAYDAIALETGIWEIHLRTALPGLWSGELRPKDAAEAAKCLQTLYRDFAIAESCVALQLPFWRRLGLRLRELCGARLLYDCMDDWQTMPEISKANRSEEPLLAQECDVLVVTSAKLAERYRAAGRAPVLVRNGADFGHFSAPRQSFHLEGMPRPVIGYFGAVADWFDYKLLREVAQARPNYSFVIIGGLELEEAPAHAAFEHLAELPNVHALGHKPYAEMPEYLAEFDVCTIPFVLNEVTNATDPVKLYEYFSQGKPVVATAMGELQQCGDLIYTAAGAEAFVQALDAAVAEPADSEKRRRRVEFAARHSWAERARALDGSIRAAFPLVSILIVTYNSADYIDLCLGSVLRQTSYPAFEVVVVDNASQDGTAGLAEHFAQRDSRVRLVRSERNLGFAGGNNRAAKEGHGEYLVFLNADTMVTPGWLDRLVRKCVTRRDIGLVGAVTNNIGNEAKIPVSYKTADEMDRFALELASKRYDETLDMSVAALFCALIPREVWKQVGPLDERFQVGMFEDDDLSLRIRKAGLRVVAAEDCFVHHFGQGSFAKLKPADYEDVFATNRRLFEEKWQTTWVEHRYRPEVSPEEGMFRPSDFQGAGDSRTASGARQ